MHVACPVTVIRRLIVTSNEWIITKSTSAVKCHLVPLTLSKIMVPWYCRVPWNELTFDEEEDNMDYIFNLHLHKHINVTRVLWNSLTWSHIILNRIRYLDLYQHHIWYQSDIVHQTTIISIRIFKLLLHKHITHVP